MANNLTGRVALVTGGSQGIGKAVCEALLAKGVQICIADINLAVGEETLRELQSKHGVGKVMFVKCDVTSDKEFEDAVLAAKSKFGRLDILVNNAGIANETNWEKTIDINLKSVMRGTLLGFKHLSDAHGNPGGTVVNTASTAAVEIVPGIPAYCASKAGVGHWTKCWGDEVNVKRTHVKVCAVCPDAADTALIWSFANPDTAVDGDHGMAILNKVKSKLMTPAHIADGFVKVLEEGVTGALLAITPENGFQYVDNEKYNL